MKKYLENKWVIVCIIWSSSILLTGWNIKNVDEAIQLKTTYEMLQQNKQYVQQNLDKIERIIEQKELSYQAIESVQFGFLSLESDLRVLSEKCRLSELKMEYNKESFSKKSMGSVPIDLFFNGSLIDGLNYMNNLEKDNPFIRIKSVKALFDRNTRKTKFEVKLTYKYRISIPKI